MGRLRLIFGSGHTKMKWIVNSLDEIQRRWAVPLVCVRVKILGEEKDLPADLQELVGALDPDNCIGARFWSTFVGKGLKGGGVVVTSHSRVKTSPTLQHQLLGWSINQLFR